MLWTVEEIDSFHLYIFRSDSRDAEKSDIVCKMTAEFHRRLEVNGLKPEDF